MTTRQSGEVLGKPVAAKKLVGEVLSAFGSTDLRPQFSTGLGFTPTSNIDAVAKGKFSASRSLEEARKVNADSTERASWSGIGEGVWLAEGA